MSLDATASRVCGSFWEVALSGTREQKTNQESLAHLEEPESLRDQIAQSRSYLCTLGPKVSIIYILGAPGKSLRDKDSQRSCRNSESRQAPVRRVQGPLWVGMRQVQHKELQGAI